MGMPFAERLPKEVETPEEAERQEDGAKEGCPAGRSGSSTSGRFLESTSLLQPASSSNMLYMDGDENIDGMPLSREERERVVHQNLAFWTARADQLEQMAADEPVEDLYPGAKPKKMLRKSSKAAVTQKPEGEAQEVPSSPDHEKEIEFVEPPNLRKPDGALDPYHPCWVTRMQKAMEKKLLDEKEELTKKKYAKVEKPQHKKEQDDSAKAPENFEDATAKQLLDKAKEEGVLKTRQSWLKLATWTDPSGESQDYFCHLCHKWAKSGHLTAPRHLRKQRQYEAQYMDDGGFDLDVCERPPAGPNAPVSSTASSS